MTDISASSIVGEIKKASRMLEAFKAAEEIVYLVVNKEKILSSLDKTTKRTQEILDNVNKDIDKTQDVIKEQKANIVKAQDKSIEVIAQAQAQAQAIIVKAHQDAEVIKSKANNDKIILVAEIDTLEEKVDKLVIDKNKLDKEKDIVDKYIARQKKKIEGIFD